MDTIGRFIATLHGMIGYASGPNREDCVLCKYEANPTEENKQAVVQTLSP